VRVVKTAVEVVNINHKPISACVMNVAIQVYESQRRKVEWWIVGEFEESRFRSSAKALIRLYRRARVLTRIEENSQQAEGVNSFLGYCSEVTSGFAPADHSFTRLIYLCKSCLLESVWCLSARYLQSRRPSLSSLLGCR